MTFNYSDLTNSFVSPDITLSGECILRLTLPEKGRLAIRKANAPTAPWPIVLMSPHTGPDFYIHIYGETQGKLIRIETTHEPSLAEIDNI